MSFRHCIAVKNNPSSITHSISYRRPHLCSFISLFHLNNKPGSYLSFTTIATTHHCVIWFLLVKGLGTFCRLPAKLCVVFLSKCGRCDYQTMSFLWLLFWVSCRNLHKSLWLILSGSEQLPPSSINVWYTQVIYPEAMNDAKSVTTYSSLQKEVLFYFWHCKCMTIYNICNAFIKD